MFFFVFFCFFFLSFFLSTDCGGLFGTEDGGGELKGRGLCFLMLNESILLWE